MNSNISARMEIIARHLGWPVSPTPTWCRHSFATNLSLSGVPTRYISESMGHSAGRSVTAGYIAEFPLEQQMAFIQQTGLHPDPEPRLLIRDPLE